MYLLFEIEPRSARVCAGSRGIHALFVLLFTLWSCASVAIGQCGASLQSGGPIGTLRGHVLSSVLWDPDGAGPMAPWLVVGGLHMTGGDQLSPVGLMAHDGTRWRGLGFDVDQSVHALTVYNGDLIAAGLFTLPTPSGSANDIARLAGSTWAPVGNGTGAGNGFLKALAVFGGELYAGGPFDSIDGLLTGPIARWNGTAWSRVAPLGFPRPSGSVYTLTVLGSLYVGGAFTFPLGLSLSGSNLGKWDGSTWSTAGNPSGTVTVGGSTSVNSLSAINGTSHATSFLFAAGNFMTIGGTTVFGAARAPYAVNTWSAMGNGLGSLTSVSLLARTPFLGSPEVLAAGNGAPCTQLWNGTSWLSLGTPGPATGSVAATAPQYYSGYVVGRYDVTDSLRTPSMFRHIGEWMPLWGTGITSAVECLADDGSDVIAGGSFVAADNAMVNGIARRVGGVWTGLGSGMAGGTATVKAVVRAASGEVFAGGSFTTAGGNGANNIARWTGNSWSPLGNGVNGTVMALRFAANGDLIVGGDFTVAGGVPCNRVARWNGTVWSPLAAGMDAAVRSLVVLPNGDVVAGGGFVLAGGVTCNRIARWDGASWSPLAGGMNADVHALALRPNGDLVAGGAFAAAGGIVCSRLARWTGSSWLPLGPGVPDTVHALAVLPDGDVLIGGRFETGATNHIARWHALTDSIVAIGNGLAGADVLAFASAPNGDVFIGGDFDAILPGTVSGHFAILSTTCPASATPVATACVGPAGPVTLVADSLPWMGSTFRSTATGFVPQALAVSVLGFTPNNLPLSALSPIGLPNCNLLASSDAVLLTVPQAGVSHYQLALPNAAVFAGVPLSHQFVQMAMAPSGVIQSLSSSNALTLVLGVL